MIILFGTHGTFFAGQAFNISNYTAGSAIWVYYPSIDELELFRIPGEAEFEVKLVPQWSNPPRDLWMVYFLFSLNILSTWIFLNHVVFFDTEFNASFTKDSEDSDEIFATCNSPIPVKYLLKRSI